MSVTRPVLRTSNYSRERGALADFAQSIVVLCRNENGATASYIAKTLGVDITRASARLDSLNQRDHLVKVKSPGRMVVFFADPGHAKAWAERHDNAEVVTSAERPPRKPQPGATSPKRRGRGPGAKGKAPPALAGSSAVAASAPSLRVDPAAVVITPEGVKRTVAKPMRFDPRYQVDPESTFEGAGFSRMGIGRYAR